jgi:hypothetical protein
MIMTARWRPPDKAKPFGFQQTPTSEPEVLQMCRKMSNITRKQFLLRKRRERKAIRSQNRKSTRRDERKSNETCRYIELPEVTRNRQVRIVALCSPRLHRKLKQVGQFNHGALPHRFSLRA